MKTVKSDTYSVVFEQNYYNSLDNYLKSSDYTSAFIIVDSNTKKYCLPVFLSKIPPELDYNIIEIPSGEKYKNLETCSFVWQQLTGLKADRKSIIFNLGGGIVTDLGGFTASTFKRAVKFINFPTTLLGMVDASVGGKTGIDFNGLKNQIGLFSNPELLIIDFSYLKTLPERQLNSGLSEIIKYGITYDKNLWENIKNTKTLNFNNLTDWIYRSVFIKNEIVLKDPKEKSLRKILNFGHTIGHSIETFFLISENKNNITHGEAVAAGMLMETYISVKLMGFPEKELKSLEKIIFRYFKKTDFNLSDIQEFLNLMKHDKKNLNNEVLFSLLQDTGNCIWNIKVPKNLIVESFNYYKGL